MIRNEVFTAKKQASQRLVEKFNFPKKNKFLGLIVLSNEKVLERLLFGIASLWVNFIVISDREFPTKSENILYLKTKEGIEEGLDFIVCDNDFANLEKLLSKWVVPISIKDNYLSSILQEFNPMKSEGNAFLYDMYDEWSIFYALIKYVENTKFPFDNKALIENVYKI
jgi:hypothetical protein